MHLFTCLYLFASVHFFQLKVLLRKDKKPRDRPPKCMVFGSWEKWFLKYSLFFVIQQDLEFVEVNHLVSSERILSLCIILFPSRKYIFSIWNRFWYFISVCTSYDLKNYLLIVLTSVIVQYPWLKHLWPLKHYCELGDSKLGSSPRPLL